MADEKWTSYKEGSKQNYGTKEDNLNAEQIQLGCMMRIADASELMAKNYLRLETDLQWYKKLFNEHLTEIKRLRKQIAAYKGEITKLKKKSNG